MSCKHNIKKYSLDETFTAPRVFITSDTATEAMYVNSTVSFSLENDIFGITVPASTIYKSVAFAALNMTDQYGIATVTPEQWTMSLTAVINYTTMTGVPAGEYEMEYAVIYPDGLKKVYGRTTILLED